MGDDRLELVIQSVKRSRNRYIIGLIIFLGFGIGAIVLSVTVPEEMGTAGYIVGGIFTALGLLVGWLTVVPILNPRDCPLVRLLRDNPEKVCWISHHAAPGGRGPSRNVFMVTLQDVDKKGHTIQVKAKRLDELMETLQAIAPRATVGYSDELNKQYAADPYSLLKDASEVKDASGDAAAKNA